MERDTEAIDVALLVPTETDDSTQDLLDEFRRRWWLGIGEDRREIPCHRCRSVGDDRVDDLVLALEVPIDSTR